MQVSDLLSIVRRLLAAFSMFNGALSFLQSLVLVVAHRPIEPASDQPFIASPSSIKIGESYEPNIDGMVFCCTMWLRRDVITLSQSVFPTRHRTGQPLRRRIAGSHRYYDFRSLSLLSSFS